MISPKPTCRRSLDRIERGVMFFMALALAVLLVVINLQVFSRYMLQYSLSWAQELVQFVFVWMVYIGVGVGVRQGLHLRINLLQERLPAKWQRRLDIFGCLVSLIIAAVFIVGGAAIARLTMLHKSPAMAAPMGCVYLIFPISGLILAAFLVEAIVRKTRSSSHDGEEAEER